MITNASEVARRQQWPDMSSAKPVAEAPQVTALVVNHNTREHISHLIFSLCRVLDEGELHRIIVVDNDSTDGSLPLLRALHERQVVTLLPHRGRYHGPGLNHGMNHLARETAQRVHRTDLVLVLDSDVIALRPGAVAAASAHLRQARAAACGHFRSPEGYAHPSCLLLDPAIVWRSGVPPFLEDGRPAHAMQRRLRAAGHSVLPFPFYREHYFLHMGHGTAASLVSASGPSNRYRTWAVQNTQPHYEGEADGPEMHRRFLKVFGAEVAGPAPDSVAAACARRERVLL